MNEEFTPGTLASLVPYEPFRRLALCGKDTWNNWRAGQLSETEAKQLAEALSLDALPPHDAPVDFSHIDFKTAKIPDFSDMNFGDYANFEEAILEKEANFSGASFGDDANFDRVKFGNEARFNGVIFGNTVTFNGATFGNRALFSGTTFGDAAQFKGTTFGFGAQFADTTFGNGAMFDVATFGLSTTFRNAVFGDVAAFYGSIFGDGVLFVGATFGVGSTFVGATFGNGARFDNATFTGHIRFNGISQDILKLSLGEVATEFGIRKKQEWVAEHLAHILPEEFGKISFAQCRFIGLADFSDRNFKAQANFRNANFVTPSLFSNIDGAENIDPTGMTVRHIGNRLISFLPWHAKEWTTDSSVAVRARQLRKLMEESKAHDVERRLFITERRLERGPLWKKNKPVALVHTLAILLFQVLSNYGRSIFLPISWFIFTLFSFHAFTRWVFNKLPDVKPRDFGDNQLMELSLGNALPFFGTLGGNRSALLADLFPSGIPGMISGSSIIHSLLSVILIFLVLLAVRNLFKIG